MKWALFFLVGCTTGMIPLSIPTETNLPIEAYFCQIDDCVAVLQQFANGSCALYSTTLFFPKNLITTKNRSSGLMHDKFCVTKDTVVTGSLNPTKKNIQEANNMVVIHSKYAAQLYHDEFVELHNNVFGGGRPVRYPEILLNNHSLKIRFCPEDDCKQEVITLLASANTSIVYALNAFTDGDIARILLQKSATINVTGVTSTWEGMGSKADWLPGIRKKRVHHKFFVVDENVIITGSANPSKNGYTRNDENIIVLRHPALARKFINEVERLY